MENKQLTERAFSSCELNTPFATSHSEANHPDKFNQKYSKESGWLFVMWTHIQYFKAPCLALG